MAFKIKDRIGIRYGRLIVISLHSQDYNGNAYWLCKCDCGKEIIVSGNHLQSEDTQSCGCLHQEITSKIMKKQIGEKAYRYINGKRCGENTKVILELKEKIRKRDNYTCQECGMTQKQSLIKYGEILSIHHIDGDDTNNVEENMVTLCRSCHRKIKRTGT